MIRRSSRLQRLLTLLKRWCKKQRGNQAFAALCCSCSASTVSDWIHGIKNPTGDQVLAIIDLLTERPLERRRKRQKKSERNVTPVDQLRPAL